MQTEETIIYGLQNGDTNMLEILYRKYGDSLYAYAKSLTKQREAAEDAVVDTFLQAYDYVKRGKSIVSLKALLFTICRNKSIDAFKNYVRNDELPEEWEIADGAISVEERVNVRIEVEKLPSPDKEIVILHCVYGLKHKEIASVLDIPEGTVRWKYRNALESLKESLGGVAV